LTNVFFVCFCCVATTLTSDTIINNMGRHNWRETTNWSLVGASSGDYWW